MAYMHDLSIFVGRRHYDRVESEGDSVSELISDPNKICYGTVPQPLIDEYSNSIARARSHYATLLDPLLKSIKLAMPKYNKTKDPASKNSVALMHELRKN